MKIRMLRNVLIEGEHHAAGEVVEVEERLAISLIRWGRAEVEKTAPKRLTTGEEPETATAEPRSERAVRPPASRRVKGEL